MIYTSTFLLGGKRVVVLSQDMNTVQKIEEQHADLHLSVRAENFTGNIIQFTFDPSGRTDEVIGTTPLKSLELDNEK